MLEFDEDYYLERNPDVAEAVRKGEWPSGMMHYCVTGYAKGRTAAPAVEIDWYLSAYPQAALEIAAGKAASAADHYHRLGKYRGYLPSQRARRPPNPAAFRSRYGGLWTDAGNALDMIGGRLDIGQISPKQAAQLTSWVNDGYVILPNAVPEAILDSAEAELDRAYRGEFPGLRFAVHGLSENTPWIPAALTHPAKALDLHWFSAPFRQAIFSRNILAFLHLIFERRVLASQTLGFWRGAAQEAHQDSAHVNYSMPMQFAAAWIALEDVREGAGELFYYAKSHRMAEFLYQSKFKGAEESKRLIPAVDLASDYRRQLELIQRQAAGVGLTPDRFLAKRGDILVWSADLAQGEGAISGSQTRKSIVTHYCPAEVAPHYFETGAQKHVKPFAATAFYSSGYYAAI